LDGTGNIKLLLVNGNTTQAVTERVVAEARRCGAPGTEVTGATARFGVSIVSTEAENDIAAHAVLDVLSETYAGHDAAILAISFDTALIGARQIVPIPVIGMTEAALHTACLLGRRFGLISFGDSSRWMYLDLVRRSGLLERMVALETIELTSTADGAQDRLVREASARLVSAGAEAVVVTGAAVAGIAHRLAPRVPVPLVDGIGCAVGQAEYLVRLGLHHRPPARRLAAESELSGVSSELASRLAGL
jgi:allantoin racemase